MTTLRGIENELVFFNINLVSDFILTHYFGNIILNKNAKRNKRSKTSPEVAMASTAAATTAKKQLVSVQKEIAVNE